MKYSISSLFASTILFLVSSFLSSWRVSGVLTKSYLIYLYNRYGEELNVQRELVENSCKRWGLVMHRFIN